VSELTDTLRVEPLGTIVKVPGSLKNGVTGAIGWEALQVSLASVGVSDPGWAFAVRRLVDNAPK